MLVCNWPHSVGKNCFFVKMLFNRDPTIQKCFRRFYRVCKAKNLVPCQPSGRPVIPSGRPAIQSTSRRNNVSYCPDAHQSKASFVWTTRTFRPDLPLCREVSICYSLHTSGRFSSTSGQLSMFNKASAFLSKTQIWEDCCNRPNDVDSSPDALIHKACIVIQIQTSRRQSAWSEHLCIRYGNCVLQINRLDDRSPSLDVRSLYMQITCSGSATVQTTGHHRPDAAQKQDRISAKFSEIESTVVRPEHP